jgi:hypothetical protein
MSNRLLSHAIAVLWLALNSNAFLICVLAVLSWGVVYGAWIVGCEIVRMLEAFLRLVLQIH